ncbi:MAG: hypothetical protein V1912_04175 [bacterium]
MKARRLVGIVGMAALVVGVLAVAGCSASQTGATTQSGATQNTAPQVTATQGSTQVIPVAKNPIVNNATQEGLQITSAMVENNVDPVTKKDLTDRLQVTLKNTSADTLTDLELFYQMIDSTTQKTEGYYQKLTGFSLAPGTEGTVYFDNETGAGHYPENTYSLYRTSANEVVISIEVSAAGYKPVMGEAIKAVGTGEKAGE